MLRMSLKVTTTTTLFREYSYNVAGRLPSGTRQNGWLVIPIKFMLYILSVQRSGVNDVGRALGALSAYIYLPK